MSTRDMLHKMPYKITTTTVSKDDVLKDTESNYEWILDVLPPAPVAKSSEERRLFRMMMVKAYYDYVIYIGDLEKDVPTQTLLAQGENDEAAYHHMFKKITGKTNDRE